MLNFDWLLSKRDNGTAKGKEKAQRNEVTQQQDEWEIS